MIITSDNNIKTSIRGFFIYSSSAIYERGDFVVYGNSIYVCSPVGDTTVSGEIPNSSNSFYPYLGDQMVDVSEFLSFSEEGGGPSKYISVSSLPAILNNYMAGLTNSGIIGDTIEYSEKNGFIVNIKEIDSDSSGLYTPTTVLSEIMIGNINHGIFKVSRELPEIRNYVYSEGGLLDSIDEYCILKQYTYINSQNQTIRVQELIDHSNGFIFYRTIPLVDWYTLKDVSNKEFKFATIHTSDLQKKANNLFKVYSARLKGFEAKLDDLQKNFRFSKISVNSGGVNQLEVSDKVEEGSQGFVDNLTEVGPITLTIFSEIENRLNPRNKAFESNSLTIDPSYGDIDYYINDDLYVSVNVVFAGIDEETGASFKELLIDNESNVSIDLGRGFMDGSLDYLINDLPSGHGSSMLLLSRDSLTESRNRVSINSSRWLDQLNQNFSFIDYSIRSIKDSNLILGPYTALLKKTNLSESWNNSFDLNRDSSNKEVLNYLVSFSDFSNIDIEKCRLQFTNTETYKFEVINFMESAIYFSGFSVDYEDENKIIQNNSKQFYGFPTRDDRGFYLYSNSVISEGIKSSVYIINSLGERIFYKDFYKNPEYNLGKCFFGTYENPIISYKELGEVLKELGGEKVIIEVSKKKSGTFILENSSEANTLGDKIVYYLTEPNTSNVLYADYLSPGSFVELSLGEYSESGYDLKVFKSLSGNDINYSISVEISNGDIIIPPSLESELLTIPWNSLLGGLTYKIVVKEADKKVYYIDNKELDLLEEQAGIKYRTYIQLLDYNNSIVFEELFSEKIYNLGQEIEMIYHPGIDLILSLEKNPISDVSVNPNNYFYLYDYIISNEDNTKVIVDSSISNGLIQPFYRFESSNEESNSNNERIRIFTDFTIDYENYRITLKERPYYRITLQAGKLLGEDLVSFSTEASGKCFTSKNDNKIPPITISNSDITGDKKIKVYSNSLIDFNTGLFISSQNKDSKLVAIDDVSGKVLWISKPQNYIGLYGDICYVGDSNTPLTSDCLLLIDPDDSEVPGLDIPKYLTIHNELSKDIRLKTFVPSTGESLELLIPSSGEYSGLLEITQYIEYIDIQNISDRGFSSVDISFDSQVEGSFDTSDVYYSGVISYGNSRKNLIDYSSLSDLSTNSSSPDHLRIKEPSVLAINIIYGDLYSTQGFLAQGPINSKIISSVQNPDSSILFLTKRNDLGVWFENLDEKYIFINFNDLDNNRLYNNIYSGEGFQSLDNESYIYGSFSNPAVKFEDLIENNKVNDDSDSYELIINSEKIIIFAENNSFSSLYLWDGVGSEILLPAKKRTSSGSEVTEEVEISLSRGCPFPMYFRQKSNKHEAFDVYINDGIDVLRTGTIFFNEDGQTSQGYRDSSGQSYFTQPDWLFSGNKIIISPAETQDIRIESTGFSLDYLTSIEYADSGYSQVNFISSDGYRDFSEFLYPNAEFRGVSFKLTASQVKFRLYKDLDDDTKYIETEVFYGKAGSDNYFTFGSMEDPVLYYSELVGYSKIEVINMSVIRNTTPSPEESITTTTTSTTSPSEDLATYSIKYSLRSRNIQSAEVIDEITEEESLLNPTGTIIEGLTISLMSKSGELSKTSRIASAYYRKYFKK